MFDKELYLTVIISKLDKKKSLSSRTQFFPCESNVATRPAEFHTDDVALPRFYWLLGFFVPNFMPLWPEPGKKRPFSRVRGV